MKRLVALGAVLASACGNATDDRPATLEYITQTILAPSCASAECHSAFKRQVGDQFDTVDATRRTIVGNQLVAFPDDVSDPAHSFLIQTLTVGTPSILYPGEGNVRMPFDSPIPDADVQLIEAWIADGAPGAQCLPNAEQRGCLATTVGSVTTYKVVECVGGTIGAIVTVCPGDQSCTIERGNGQCLAR